MWDIWNMVLGCLMWVVWLERNRRSFEALERTLVSYKHSVKILFLNGLSAGDLQTFLLLWSSFLPLEVPLKFLCFFFFCCFGSLFFVFTIMNTYNGYFAFFHDEYKSHYLSKKKTNHTIHT